METRVLVLAGGKGTRMGANVPKAMVSVAGKPIVDRILEAIKYSGVDDHPALVVGHDLEQLQEYVGDRAEFVIQYEQKGTGHAVMVAEEQLRDVKHVIVLYGDHPLYSADTINRLVSSHEDERAVITMTTVTVPDYKDWREVYTHYGRIIRDENGIVKAIKEYKMCSDDERKITEVNNGLYCFDGEWLWKNIKKLSDDNAKGEYLLTDLISMAVRDDKLVETSNCPDTEGIGVNTPEEVDMAEAVIENRISPKVAIEKKIVAKQ
jgi:bifunctional UDP-N-acetylglucosamine pyrophosphorylase / glucosamine-1-phosphate N-acetyltransferase